MALPIVNAEDGEAYSPFWVPDNESSFCSDCEASFTLLNRRHHCRLCGLLYCQACSPVRITNVEGATDGKFYRLCQGCGDDLVTECSAVALPEEVMPSSLFCGVRPCSRVLAVVDPDALQTVMLERPSRQASSLLAFGIGSSSVHSADTSSSTFETCPVCSAGLWRMSKKRAQQHVSGCLEEKRGSVVGSCYSVTELTTDVGDKECGICYEPLLKGQEAATLNCLCQFHRSCIDKWFTKKRACPFHYS